MSKQKPCPFCGSEFSFSHISLTGPAAINVRRCSDCGAEAKEEMWNRRVLDLNPLCKEPDATTEVEGYPGIAHDLLTAQNRIQELEKEQHVPKAILESLMLRFPALIQDVKHLHQVKMAARMPDARERRLMALVEQHFLDNPDPTNVLFDSWASQNPRPPVNKHLLIKEWKQNPYSHRVRALMDALEEECKKYAVEESTP